jgi:hypothetical protein
LDEGAVAQVRGESLSGLVGDVIRLEQGDSPEDLRLAIGKLREHLKGSEYDSLRRAFRVWIERVVIQRVANEKVVVHYEDLEDIESMLAEKVSRWTEEWKRQGLEQGLEQGLVQGIEQGRALGMRQSLSNILLKRFGTGVDLRPLDGASCEQLQLWLDRAIDAETYGTVFEDEASD